MPAELLTDRGVRSLKPIAKPYDVMDGNGLAIRVMSSGHKTFVFISRFGSRHPARRSLGAYSPTAKGTKKRTDDELLAMTTRTLAEAREKAQLWRDTVAAGKDPQAEMDRRLREQRQKDAVTFAAVVEAYIADVAVGPDPAHPRQRKGREVAADLRRVFVPLWGQRVIADITRREVQAVIKDVRDHGTDES